MSKQQEIINEKRKLALLRTIFETILSESAKQGDKSQNPSQSTNKDVNKANAK